MSEKSLLFVWQHISLANSTYEWCEQKAMFLSHLYAAYHQSLLQNQQ